MSVVRRPGSLLGLTLGEYGLSRGAEITPGRRSGARMELSAEHSVLAVQVVDVGEHVAVAGDHTGVEKLVGNVPEVSLQHEMRLDARDAVDHST